MNDFEKKIEEILKNLSEIRKYSQFSIGYYGNELLNISINELQNLKEQIPQIDPLEKEDVIEKAYYEFPSQLDSISKAYDEGFLAYLKIRTQNIK